MFGIKRRGREQSAKIHRLISGAVAPWIERVSGRLRFPARKRLLNRWGSRHPRRVVALYAAFAVSILLWNVAGLVIGSPEKGGSDPLGLAQRLEGNPFDGMLDVNRNRESIREAVSELAETNVRLANRLDSLCSLRVKTRRDSIEIMTICNKLNNKTVKPDEPKTD